MSPIFAHFSFWCLLLGTVLIILFQPKYEHGFDIIYELQKRGQKFMQTINELPVIYFSLLSQTNKQTKNLNRREYREICLI